MHQCTSESGAGSAWGTSSTGGCAASTGSGSLFSKLSWLWCSFRMLSRRCLYHVDLLTGVRHRLAPQSQRYIASEFAYRAKNLTDVQNFLRRIGFLMSIILSVPKNLPRTQDKLVYVTICLGASDIKSQHSQRILVFQLYPSHYVSSPQLYPGSCCCSLRYLKNFQDFS